MPKAEHPPAFQFYVDDFISDGNVDAMTNQEVGIYIRLMCKAWKEEPVGTIPADDAVLARWAKETPKEWRKCRAAVLRAFELGEDGRYHQKRMKAEWLKLLLNREARSKNGSKGAAKRWQSDGQAIDSPMAKNGTSSSSSSSSSNHSSSSSSNSVSIGPDAERQRQVTTTTNKLAAFGVNEAGPAVELALSRGVGLDEIEAIMNHYRREGGCEPAALCYRIKTQQPGQRPETGWVPKWKRNTELSKRERDQAREGAAYRIIKAGRAAKKPDDAIKADLAAAGLEWPQ